MPNMNDFFRKHSEVTKPTTIGMHIRNIDYSKLMESSYQYRELKEEDIKTLAELILLDGRILQPLVVRKSGADSFEILAGHKRKAACKYLVEERGEEAFRLLPCYISELSDVQAEFAVYSTNGYHQKTPYEIMREIEGIKRLILEHPENFPKSKGQRTVELIAREIGLTRTVVSEYQSISHNLVEEGKDALQRGELDKSAALVLAKLPEGEQRDLLNKKITSYTEIKNSKKSEKREKESRKSCRKNIKRLDIDSADNDQITGQMQVEDFPQVMPEKTKVHDEDSQTTTSDRTKAGYKSALCSEIKRIQAAYLAEDYQKIIGLCQSVLWHCQALLQERK